MRERSTQVESSTRARRVRPSTLTAAAVVSAIHRRARGASRPWPSSWAASSRVAADGGSREVARSALQRERDVRLGRRREAGLLPSPRRSVARRHRIEGAAERLAPLVRLADIGSTCCARWAGRGEPAAPTRAPVRAAVERCSRRPEGLAAGEVDTHRDAVARERASTPCEVDRQRFARLDDGHLGGERALARCGLRGAEARGDHPARQRSHELGVVGAVRLRRTCSGAAPEAKLWGSGRCLRKDS